MINKCCWLIIIKMLIYSPGLRLKLVRGISYLFKLFYKHCMFKDVSGLSFLVQVLKDHLTCCSLNGFCFLEFGSGLESVEFDRLKFDFVPDLSKLEMLPPPILPTDGFSDFSAEWKRKNRKTLCSGICIINLDQLRILISLYI